MVVVEENITRQVDVLEEADTPADSLSELRRVTVELPTGDSESGTVHVNHGGLKDALVFTLNRTIRVPDNNDTNMLPPSLGQFPLFKVQDYASRMPEDMASKGGLFFPMYQREAMWINFQALIPFAIKMYVGGVNAVSGLPVQENDKTREKRLKMLKDGKQIQDYMVVPGQHWLDGIVSEDGKIRQFIAKPKGSGFSVEAQVTGEEKVGGIQIEVIPVKREVPKDIDVRYENAQKKVIKRTVNLAEKGLGEQSTWLDLKKMLRDEFDVAVQDQELGPYPWGDDIRLNIADDALLSSSYFKPGFTLGLSHSYTPAYSSQSLDGIASSSETASYGSAVPVALMAAPAPYASFPAGASEEESMDLAFASDGAEGESFSVDAAPEAAVASRSCVPMKAKTTSEKKKKTAAAAAPSKVKEMGLAAGGFIQQTIEPDKYPTGIWDTEASIMFNIQILDSEAFSEVTGLPPPATPVDAATYAQHNYPFFELWGEEKTGVKGDFSEVKSVAQIEAEQARAKGEAYEPEQSVPQRVHIIGKFRSTFRPLEILMKELDVSE